jgi:NADH-quinone oxidoreductase E subunit
MPNNAIIKELEALKSQYHDVRFCLLPGLHICQKAYGWLSPESLEALGEAFAIPRATVKSVATFYALFRHRPIGRHMIQLCTNVACMMHGGRTLLELLEERYGLGENGTSPDGRFSLVVMECIGACDEAPAMLVDTDLHGRLTADRIIEILETYP